ncbi:MAG: transglutaminase-like domain-containing protein [Chloroflexota bacterium]
MGNRINARQHFQRLIRQPESELNLAQAALAIAQEDQDSDILQESLRELQNIAERIRTEIDRSSTTHDRVRVLNHYLFEQLGFHGNETDYYNPANSFLDQVLATKVGLPITLSVVYMEVGLRLQLPISGVALPGHFIVRYHSPEGDIYIDPFHRGRLWSYAECEAHIIAAYGDIAPETISAIMEPLPKNTILERMLRNLKHTYITSNNFERALAAVERILLIDPHNFQELRDRGILRARLHLYHLALMDLEHYAEHVYNAPDLPTLRLQARAIAEHIIALN